jgi:hypothetical protein
MYRSLEEHAGTFTLYVLCLDEYTYETLHKLNRPNLVPISLPEFEAGDTALLEAKKNRSRVEYFFTCSPSLPLYIFREHPEVTLVSYVDADLFFVSSLEPIYAELGDRSILIIDHKFPERLKHMAERGVFNVGFLTFRRDSTGLACLKLWREQCLEWCYDRLEDGRYADQKYLDQWPDRFNSAVTVLRHKGANVGPWNWMNYDIRCMDRRVEIDGEPLIFYHFAGMKILNRWLCNPGLSWYGKSMLALHGKSTFALRRYIYRPYLRALQETRAWANPGYHFQRARGGMLMSIARGMIYRDLLITIGNLVI